MFWKGTKRHHSISNSMTKVSCLKMNSFMYHTDVWGIFIFEARNRRKPHICRNEGVAFLQKYLMQIRAPLPDLAKKQPASFLPHIFVLIHVSVRNTERMQNYVFRGAGIANIRKRSWRHLKMKLGWWMNLQKYKTRFFKKGKRQKAEKTESCCISFVVTVPISRLFGLHPNILLSSECSLRPSVRPTRCGLTSRFCSYS